MARTINDILKGGQKIAEKQIKKNLFEQGHYFMGAVERSIKSTVNGNTIEGSAFQYLLDLNNGIKAGDLKFDKTFYLRILSYLKVRTGLKGKALIREAQTVINDMKKEGIPTKRGYKFSKNRKRKNAVDDALNSPELDKHILDGMDEYVGQFFNKQKTETI